MATDARSRRERARRRPLPGTAFDKQARRRLARRRTADITANVRDAFNRNFPLIHPERTFPRPAADRVFPVTIVDPAFGFMPGYSKRALLGERIYPFAELFVDPISDISTIEWKQTGVAFASVSVGAYPDLYTAAKFVEFLPQVFDNNLVFSLKITDTSANIIEKDVSVISNVEIAAHKAVLADQRVRPFSDATFADDAALITAIKYEISGASTVAKTVIPVEQFLAGTHDGVSNSASLIDSTKNFLMLGIRINDIVKNTTDGSQALVTAFAKTTNDNDTLTLDGLSGGTDDDFDGSDSYTITDGDSLINRVKKFELTLTAVGLHTVTLYVTDASVEFSDVTNIEVG